MKLFTHPFYERTAPFLSFFLLVLGTAILFYEAKMSKRTEKLFYSGYFFLFWMAILPPLSRMELASSILVSLLLTGIGMLGLVLRSKRFTPERSKLLLPTFGLWQILHVSVLIIGGTKISPGVYALIRLLLVPLLIVSAIMMPRLKKNKPGVFQVAYGISVALCSVVPALWIYRAVPGEAILILASVGVYCATLPFFAYFYLDEADFRPAEEKAESAK